MNDITFFSAAIATFGVTLGLWGDILNPVSRQIFIINQEYF